MPKLSNIITEIITEKMTKTDYDSQISALEKEWDRLDGMGGSAHYEQQQIQKALEKLRKDKEKWEKLYKSVFSEAVTKPPLLFLRNTQSPENDLRRGFSCNVNAWFTSQEDADRYQDQHGALNPPIYDEMSNKWCADPENGLSGYSFKDFVSFEKAYKNFESYNTDDNFAVFSATDYGLGDGLDGEDTFKKGVFVGWIPNSPKTSDMWKTIVNTLYTRTKKH